MLYTTVLTLPVLIVLWLYKGNKPRYLAVLNLANSQSPTVLKAILKMEFTVVRIAFLLVILLASFYDTDNISVMCLSYKRI